MNRFKKIIDFVIVWVTILWNMVAVLISGTYGVCQLGNTGYSSWGENAAAMGVFWGITILINVMNIWIRMLLRSKR